MPPSSLLITHASLALRVILALLAIVPVCISGVYIFPGVRSIVSCSISDAKDSVLFLLCLCLTPCRMTFTFSPVICSYRPRPSPVLVPCGQYSRFNASLLAVDVSSITHHISSTKIRVSPQTQSQGLPLAVSLAIAILIPSPSTGEYSIAAFLCHFFNAIAFVEYASRSHCVARHARCCSCNI
jgi:hypothetical protein